MASNNACTGYQATHTSQLARTLCEQTSHIVSSGCGPFTHTPGRGTTQHQTTPPTNHAGLSPDQCAACRGLASLTDALQGWLWPGAADAGAARKASHSCAAMTLMASEQPAARACQTEQPAARPCRGGCGAGRSRSALHQGTDHELAGESGALNCDREHGRCLMRGRGLRGHACLQWGMGDGACAGGLLHAGGWRDDGLDRSTQQLCHCMLQHQACPMRPIIACPGRPRLLERDEDRILWRLSQQGSLLQA